MLLSSNEQLLKRERMHPGIFALPVLVILAFLAADIPVLIALRGLASFTGSQSPLMTLLILLPTLVVALSVLLITLFAYMKSEVTLTNKRLMYRTGVITRATGELPLENVEGVFLFEPLLGRLTGYGTVTVTTVGGLQLPLAYIGKPQVFQAALQSAVTRAKAPTAPPSRSAVPQDDSRYMPKF